MRQGPAFDYRGRGSFNQVGALQYSQNRCEQLAISVFAELLPDFAAPSNVIHRMRIKWGHGSVQRTLISDLLDTAQFTIFGSNVNIQTFSEGDTGVAIAPLGIHTSILVTKGYHPSNLTYTSTARVFNSPAIYTRVPDGAKRVSAFSGPGLSPPYGRSAPLDTYLLFFELGASTPHQSIDIDDALKRQVDLLRIGLHTTWSHTCVDLLDTGIFRVRFHLEP